MKSTFKKQSFDAFSFIKGALVACVTIAAIFGIEVAGTEVGVKTTVKLDVLVGENGGTDKHEARTRENRIIVRGVFLFIYRLDVGTQLGVTAALYPYGYFVTYPN